MELEVRTDFKVTGFHMWWHKKQECTPSLRKPGYVPVKSKLRHPAGHLNF